MPPVAGNDAAAEKRIAPVQVHFCTLILNRSGFLNPFSLILQLLLQFDPFFVDAFEMAVRPFHPVIQKSGHAEDQGNQHHPDPQGSLSGWRNPGKSFLWIIHCAMKT